MFRDFTVSEALLYSVELKKSSIEIIVDCMKNMSLMQKTRRFILYAVRDLPASSHNHLNVQEQLYQ